MVKKSKIQLYRTSGETKPSSENLDYGEIGVQYKGDNEKLYIKNTNGSIESFLSTAIINRKMAAMQENNIDFSVTYNVGTTESSVYFKSANPSKVTITKTYNGTQTVTLVNQSTATTDTVTSQIQYGKETFKIESYPTEDDGVPVVMEETRYLCFIGASTSETIDSSSYKTFGKEITNGNCIGMVLHTNDNEYTWIVVPKSLPISRITSDGISFKTNDAIEINDTEGFGEMLAYRSTNKLSECDWNIIIQF